MTDRLFHPTQFLFEEKDPFQKLLDQDLFVPEVHKAT